MSVARFITDQRTNYRVPHTITCALLGVSLSWFYKWLGRTPTPTEQRRSELDTAVAEAFKKDGAAAARLRRLVFTTRPEDHTDVPRRAEQGVTMTGQPLTSTRQVRLDLSLPDVSDLSTVCRDGSLLWLAGDEKPSRVIRLAADGAGAYADPAPFPLAECVDLPEGPNEEVDIEALDIRDQHLWVIGSHSATRKQARPHDSEKEARKNLRTVEQHPNRNLILRLPLDGDGNDRRPVSAAPGSQGAPRCYTGLREALADDKHLGPFLPIPGKDNGLDIEGLTALDDTLLLGLRGPVLRGWAVLLEVDPTALAPASKDSYRKFFLDLGGLGIRDLCRIDDDVLILAGPTMDLDGPTRLYRWPGAATTRTTTVLTDDQFIRYDLARDPAATEGSDHPEGVTGLSGGDPAEVLVIYDSPSAARAPDDDSTLADIYALPPA